MKIQPIESNIPIFQHKVETKVFYKNPITFNQQRNSSRIVDKITLDNGKKIYIDTTTIGGKILFKVKSLYDETGKFVRSITESYKDGKIIEKVRRDWE